MPVSFETVSPDDGEVRLDRWFHRHYPQLTQGQIQKMIRLKQIKVDGKRAEANQRVTAGRPWARRKNVGKALSCPTKTRVLCKVW